jgi:hypothetical protein
MNPDVLAQKNRAVSMNPNAIGIDGQEIFQKDKNNNDDLESVNTYGAADGGIKGIGGKNHIKNSLM